MQLKQETSSLTYKQLNKRALECKTFLSSHISVKRVTHWHNICKPVDPRIFWLHKTCFHFLKDLKFCVLTELHNLASLLPHHPPSKLLKREQLKLVQMGLPLTSIHQQGFCPLAVCKWCLTFEILYPSSSSCWLDTKGPGIGCKVIHQSTLANNFFRKITLPRPSRLLKIVYFSNYFLEKLISQWRLKTADGEKSPTLPYEETEACWNGLR